MEGKDHKGKDINPHHHHGATVKNSEKAYTRCDTKTQK
jgi:hypothetical protein